MVPFHDKRLAEVVSRILKVTPDAVTLATSQENTTEWDSLAHLNLILEIESMFRVRFSSEEIPTLISVGLLHEALERHGAFSRQPDPAPGIKR